MRLHKSVNPRQDKIQEWFSEGHWLQGWKILPDPSINREAFSRAYTNKTELWSKAFDVLVNEDLEKIQTGDYKLDGNRLLMKVQQYLTRDEADTRYEAHRKYADIQHVVSGMEKIGVVCIGNTEVIVPYDHANDVVFLRSKEDQYHIAAKENFFIFLPDNAHRPCVKTSIPTLVKKIVLKVRID